MATVTGKSKGLKKGDFVFTGAFPGIIVSDVHTFAPCCEVWGFEHESGSCYATDLRKITKEEFINLAKQQPCGFNGIAYSKVAQDALKGV